MDNQAAAGGGGIQQNTSQPNGILPRPQSRVRSRPMSNNTNTTTTQPQSSSVMYPQPSVNRELSLEDEFQDPYQTTKEHHGKESGRGLSRSRSKDESSEKEKDPLSHANMALMPKFLKIAVVGSPKTGKTCLCNAVTNDAYTFNKNYQLTCGVNVFPKSVKLPSAAADEQPAAGHQGVVEPAGLNMALLDSSGQSVYTTYLPKYWEKLDGFILVMDLTSQTALTEASVWLKRVKGSCKPKEANNGNLPLGVLLGNKNDINRRKVGPKEAKDFATQNGLQYFECSVKDASGLEEPFFYLAHKWSTVQTA